jgi:hypothetical protein
MFCMQYGQYDDAIKWAEKLVAIENISFGPERTGQFDADLDSILVVGSALLDKVQRQKQIQLAKFTVHLKKMGLKSEEYKREVR